jgi:hypothetical protein
VPLVELAPFELTVLRHRVRNPGQLGEVAERLPGDNLRAPLPLQRQAERAHLQLAVAVGVLVDDPDRDRPDKREARSPGEGDAVDREALDGAEAHRAVARLRPHLPLLPDPHLPGNRAGGRERALEVALFELG